jgi:hypothetical protein
MFDKKEFVDTYFELFEEVNIHFQRWLDLNDDFDEEIEVKHINIKPDFQLEMFVNDYKGLSTVFSFDFLF